MRKEALVIPREKRGERLDTVLTSFFPGSRSSLASLIRDGHVTVNGKGAKPGQKVRGGEEVIVLFPPPPPSTIVPEEIDVPVVYEDDVILVINKPRGMVVHPGAGRRGGTLVNALVFRIPELREAGGQTDAFSGRPGIVHRLDKDTSGLLVVAKTREAHEHLSAQMSAREVKKEYLALVWGKPERKQGRIDAPVGRDYRSRVKMGITQKGRRAVTDFQALEEFRCPEMPGFPGCTATFLSLKPVTGRTHQLRVHCASIGCPIIGDQTYGGQRSVQSVLSRTAVRSGRGTTVKDSASTTGSHEKQLLEALLNLQGQLLHAWKLEFTHPRRKERMGFEAPLPPEMLEILSLLRKLSGQGYRLPES